MIDNYAVKFFNGVDWMTFKIFNHKEENQAIDCAKCLVEWVDVCVVTTITQAIIYKSNVNLKYIKV